MNTDEPISVTIREYWVSLSAKTHGLSSGQSWRAVIVAGVLCLVLPKSYRSSTLILIENAKIQKIM